MNVFCKINKHGNMTAFLHQLEERPIKLSHDLPYHCDKVSVEKVQWCINERDSRYFDEYWHPGVARVTIILYQKYLIKTKQDKKHCFFSPKPSLGAHTAHGLSFGLRTPLSPGERFFISVEETSKGFPLSLMNWIIFATASLSSSVAVSENSWCNEYWSSVFSWHISESALV